MNPELHLNLAAELSEGWGPPLRSADRCAFETGPVQNFDEELTRLVSPPPVSSAARVTCGECNTLH